MSLPPLEVRILSCFSERMRPVVKCSTIGTNRRNSLRSISVLIFLPAADASQGYKTGTAAMGDERAGSLRNEQERPFVTRPEWLSLNRAYVLPNDVPAWGELRDRASVPLQAVSEKKLNRIVVRHLQYDPDLVV